MMLIIRILIIWPVVVAGLGKHIPVFPVITDPSAILYKGTVGTLPCGYQRKISSVAWYKGESLANASALILLEIERNGDPTRSGPGFTRGEVDITDDFSLIIKRVKVEDERRYYCSVADLENELSFNNYTDVYVVAFASGPVIEPCVMKEGRLHTDLSACTYDASNHSTKFNFTCKLSGFKPDVSLSWSNTSEDLEPLHSTKTTLADGTLERTVTVEFDPRKAGTQNLTCTARGTAVNGTVSTSVFIVNTNITVGDEMSKNVVIGGIVTLIIIVVILSAVFQGRKLRITEAGFGTINWSSVKYRVLATLLGENYQRKELIKMAMKAQQERRYDDVVKHMTEVIAMKQRLSDVERRLLKDAYHKLVNEPRTLLCNLDYVNEDSEKETMVRHRRNVIREDREKIQLQLLYICEEVVKMLDECLIKHVSSTDAVDYIEEQIFYRTMKGDYIRYMLSQSNEESESLTTRAEAAYEEAMTLSINALSPAHAMRLRICLKLSLFYDNILHQRQKACTLCRQAIMAAIEDFEDHDNDDPTERREYMLMLHKNLKFWTNDNRQGQNAH